MSHRSFLAASVALALLGPVAALGQTALPQTQEFQGIRYVTGGVGSDEVEALRQVAKDYSLGMTFAAQTGQFVSGVKVELKNPKGDVVLATVSDGPMVLADVPKGRYTVEATFDGRTQRRDVSVDDKTHRRVVMHWPVAGLSPGAQGSGTEAQPGR